MHSNTLAAALVALLPAAFAATSVSGSPEGFGKGTTGGAAGQTVTPTSIDELTSYLTSSDPLTIVLTKTFDYTDSEGSTTETGCAPWGTASGCQLAINANSWCDNYESDAPSVSVTYNKAATTPINVASDKSIVGQGDTGIIKGKGLRFANDVSNIIVQNIHITELNPQYVWGGDAITLDGSSKIWIDHVKTSLIGRQHIVAGYETNTAITISNHEVDGKTSWSATCDGSHYWALYFTGKNDQITFKGNYIHNTSGRSPKVDEGTLIHAVNNYWADNTGHAFEGEDGYVLVEGSTFDNVAAPEQGYTGSMFAPTTAPSECSSSLGRACVADVFTSSGTLDGSDTSFLSKFDGLTIASAASDASDVPTNAGFGGSLSSSDSKSTSERRVKARSIGGRIWIGGSEDLIV
ncbi:polysaccharide lyase family 1 protein [Dothistroma septosporum NZE10]|uniref:pectin lyase n=1 Tax=Dothistroma septosporum (strain NZE10 / CBS 128990) TaxID=675120 RepID=N1PRK5_DOTSN|nr:polysaccharide lyase family 1 protein [Dothistroma septosporum NZE10]